MNDTLSASHGTYSFVWFFNNSCDEDVPCSAICGVGRKYFKSSIVYLLT